MAAQLLSTLARLLFIGSLVLSVAAARPNPPCLIPKVRKEWRQLSKRERQDWIGAVNVCLGTLSHDPKLKPTVPTDVSLIPPVSTASSFYDDIAYIHMDLNFDIHYTGFFLPWHRYYVQFFEDSLVKKCGYKGAQPYWDWTIDAHDVYNASIWDDSPSGLGRWGDPANDYQIYSGGFKDQIRAYPSPHHIRRNYSLFPFANSAFSGFMLNVTSFMPNSTMTRENVVHMVGGFDGDFIGFHSYFEGLSGSHAGAHLIVSGDMGGLCPYDREAPECYAGAKWTPNDPIFFLHHAMVDKLWYDWQNRLPMNKFAFGGGSVSAFGEFPAFFEFPTGAPPYLNFSSKIPGDGLWEDVSIWDVMDTRAGALCYVYA
ncbi:Di-copper centre-containing protein [Thelephora ganbajun]|uniref:Di-copper centre-containing protein n=1 Tax=Thelephora ganbajun TaxID=370292 RepID=A0ACB6ZF33_THEGA|nr:Di-copper centre-containing protein [Thelephora ganbajun]